MKFEFKVNKEKESLEVYYKGELISVLDEDDTFDFFEDLKEAKVKYESSINVFETVGLEDMEEALEVNELSLEEIEGIHINVAKNFNTKDVEGHVLVNLKNGDEEYVNVDILENFKEEEVFFGVATNHEIRGCFDRELINFLKRNEDVEIWFNDQEISLEELLDEEETHWFDYSEWSGS